jgi:hypothetical protein
MFFENITVPGLGGCYFQPSAAGAVNKILNFLRKERRREYG